MTEKKETIEAFYKECAWARHISNQSDTLFDSGELHLDIMSETANSFFHDLSWVMLEYVILQQCKLTDHAFMGKKSNLTTNYILTLNWDPITKARLEGHNSRLMELREKIKDIRNHTIAHLDRTTKVGSNTFGKLSKQENEEFWLHLEKFISCAYEETFGEACEIDMSTSGGGAFTLLYCLADAVDYEDLVNSRPDFLSERLGKRRFEL